VVNWHEREEANTVIDFVRAGVAASDQDACTLTDLWTGNLIGTFIGTYTTETLLPHANLSFRVTCAAPI